MGRPRRRGCARGVRPRCETLESRRAPAIGFGTVVGLGATGQYADLRANAEAIDAAGDLVVVGSFMGTAGFNPAGSGNSVAASGNRDAYVAEYSPSGALNWVTTFPGQATSAVGQVSAVSVDSAGNIEVAGSFSGTVKFGTATLAAPSRTDAFVAKLSGSGAVLWAVQTTGAANKVDSAVALAPDGSGGAYVAGSYMGTMAAGSTPLTAVGQTEAWAAHVNASGQFVWAKSTSGSAGSVAGMNGLAVDPSGRVVMAGYFANSVNFSPAGSAVLVGAGSYDVAAWVLNGDGSFAWAEGFGGSGYDQADAVAVDPSGNVYVTGAFSGTVNFNPSGTALSLTAKGIYDVFVLKLSSAGATAWADSFAGSNGPAMGDGIGIDPSGRVIVAGWFVGTLDFDPGVGSNPVASKGAEDVFVATLDASGNAVGVTTGGGSGSDMAFGLAINASGSIAVAGTYTGASVAPPGPTSFGSTTLATIGKVDIFVASLGQSGGPPAPAAPILEAASDSGASPSDGITNVTSPTFDVTATTSGLTVQLLRDGVVVASRVGSGPLVDPGRVADGVHQYTARQVDSGGNVGAAGAATQVTIDTTAPAPPSALGLFATDDSGTVGDGITNVNRPRLSGTAEAGATVGLYLGGTLVGTGVAAGGTFTILLASALADGTYSVAVTATDLAGNTSAASPSFVFTIDTKPPAVPDAPVLLPADDSGVVGDGLTNVKKPRLTGTAEPGATVRLYAGGTLLGSGTATGGTYTILLGTALADGSYAITATATDAAGNVSSAGAPLSLTIDTAAPAAPPAPTLFAADDSGATGDGITNIARPRLTGTAASGSTVKLSIGGVVVAQGVATNGTYTIQLGTPLPDGTYSVTASATDAAGNTSAPGAAFALTIDTTAPAAPSAPGLLVADDSGTVGDGLTNITRPRLTGTAEAGSTVRLTIAGSLVGSGTAVGGSYTIQLSAALGDGIYLVLATATDAAGNTSLPGAAFVLTIDATPPAAPPAPSLVLADDTGTVGDGITSVTRPHLSGTAEPGATVRLFLGGALVGTGTATVGGSYSILLNSALADGTYSVTATATDAAGNTSAPGAAFALTIDTTAPAAPTIGLLAADDTGAVGDGITAVVRPRFTGTAEPGSTVFISLLGGLIGSGVASSGGVYTILPFSALPDGVFAITATVTDAAGNTGAAARLTLTIDTTPPAAPPAPGLASADDSGVKGDGITNVARPHLTGSAESGAIITLAIGGTVVGSGLAVGGTYSILLNAPLADGTYSVTATATDAAGNAGLAGAPSALTIDTTAPSAPPAPGLLTADDSGAVGDGLTNVAKPRMTGSAEPGSTVRLYAGGALVGTGTATGGSYTIGLASALADGTYTITATATDSAGNIGAPGPGFVLTIDTTPPPAPPAPGLLAADDSGTPGDGVTDDTTPRLAGTATAGTTVRVYVGATLVGTATAAGGTYTVAVAAPLADGTYNVTATATDSAGNTSLAGVAFRLTIDTTAPSSPPAPGLLAADDSGTVGDGITNVNKPRFSGTVEPGSIVRLYLGGNLVGSATATGGAYLIGLASALADGTYTLAVTATDVAGNTSAAGAAFTLTIDTAAPAAPSVPVLAAADDTGAVGDGITAINKPHLSGTAEADSTVRLYAGGKLLGSAVATGGSYAVALSPALADGTYVITATSTDAAGNVSTASAPLLLAVDTTPPAAPPAPGLPADDDSGTLGDGITSVVQPRLTGTAEAGSTVRLYIAGALVGTGTAAGGSYTIALNAPLADGAYLVVARATDAAGNAGPAGSPFALTIDTTAPAAPPAPGLLAADDSGTVGDGVTNVNTPRLTGKAEPGATVRLYAGGILLATATATGGTYTVALAPALADGTYAITAAATDAAGNVGPAGASFSLTIDTAAPAAPSVPVLAAADDSGTAGDGITNVKAPRLSGTAESGSTVSLYAGGKMLGTATATGGAYTIAVSPGLADGTYVITATATDAAGNVSPAGAPLTLTIDTTAPAAPGLGLLAADDTGVKGDGVTAVHHPRVSGLAEPGSLVQLLDGGGNILASVRAASDGSYMLTTPNHMAGTFAYRVRAVDAAGNAGPAGAPLSVRILAVAGDFDGDGKADPMTYNVATGVWTILLSTTGATTHITWGIPGRSVAIPADYSGNGRTDLAVYVPSTGDWYIYDPVTQAVTHYTWGQPGDVPVPADYTGIGRAEPALYRPSTAQWFVYNPLSYAVSTWTFGFANQSVPEPAPYAGYGTADLAVYQPTTGDWYSVNTTTWALVHTAFGGPGFAPAPADYDGDGKADVALYWPAQAQWLIVQSSTGTNRFVIAGTPNLDWPAPADYDGDGKADPATYRPTTSTFNILRSSDGAARVATVGQAGDVAALVPWSYLYAEVVQLGSAQPAIRPALAATAPTSSPAVAAPTQVVIPSAANAVRAAVSPSTGKGSPVPQPIRWRGWATS